MDYNRFKKPCTWEGIGMKTVQATDTAVSIWVSREAPPSREQMLRLVRQALAEEGLAPWGSTEAECFAAGEETLIIARPARPKRCAFYFSDLEALLGGALRCPPAESALYAAGEGYILAVEPEGVTAALYEFGEPREAGPLWEAHAREQGMCLIREDAVAALSRYFSR